jgi:hypothetical protein
MLTMKSRILLAVLLGALVVPAAAFAAGPSGQDRANAARTCKSLRATLGPTLFGQTYGTAQSNRKNAMGRCVSQHARAEHQNGISARDECAAERNDPNFPATHDGKSFQQFYGNFGRCVSSKARAARAEERSDTLNAARQCKAERTRLGITEFRRTYGRGPSDRNAFGKCVSALARAQND